jgi:hypothetical protein
MCFLYPVDVVHNDLGVCGRVSAASFFAFDPVVVDNYLIMDRYCGAFRSGWPVQIDIFSLRFSPSGYNNHVIIRTIWIRLIQRHWRKTFSCYQATLQQRKQWTALRYREIKGTWPLEIMNLPSLKGLLHAYKNQ